MRDYPEEYDRDIEGAGLDLFEQAWTDYESPWHFYRTHYRYTSCGVSVGMLIRQATDAVAEEPVIEWIDGEPVQVGTVTVASPVMEDRWRYCDDLGKLGSFADMRKAGQDIVALSVSSIVEGVDYDTGTQIVELKPDEQTEEQLREAWDAAVTEVEEEAASIWRDTHGCDACRQHWADEGFGDGTIDGAAPIWEECPECEGDGVFY